MGRTGLCIVLLKETSNALSHSHSSHDLSHLRQKAVIGDADHGAPEQVAPPVSAAASAWLRKYHWPERAGWPACGSGGHPYSGGRGSHQRSRKKIRP
jgi:hypothetical protein